MKLFPSSLYGRFLLMILFPILALQFIVIVIFYERHWENVVNRMQDSLISEIEVATSLLNQATNHNQKELLQKLNLLKLNIKILPRGKEAKIQKTDQVLDKTIKDFFKILSTKLSFPVKNTYIKNNTLHCIINLKHQEIIVSFSQKRIKSPTTYIFILWTIVTSIMFAVISSLFMKNQVKSILKLAKAAERLGKGQKVKNYKPAGAKEIKIAGLAFVKMQKRIERQIMHRTKMLAHISHDLRTPLTRIKLRLSLLNSNEAIESINQNLNEMEKMLQNYLEFAKEDGNEQSKKINLTNLIKEILITYSDDRIILKMPKLKNQYIYIKVYAIKRAISNIIDNAIKYAKNIIEINIVESKSEISFIFDDDGIGIKKNMYNEALKPFTKLNNNKDGFGLGLSIASSITSSHGGKLLLSKSPIDGLRVTLTLPR